MRKNFSSEELEAVRKMALDGKNNTEIANLMAKAFPLNWRSKYAHRMVPKIIKGYGTIDETEEKTLDEMGREERFRFIENKLQKTPRFKITFKNFAKEEKDVFTEEYLSIVRSTETLTEAEEQALFASILELVLALQSLSRKQKEEQLLDQTLDGKIPQSDPRYRTMVDPRYQKEYDSHMRLYQAGMEQLKMSRSQRLKEVRSQKQTLVDLAEELSAKNAQAEVADEIERLSKLKDEELKKMIENGYIYGVFDEF